MNENQDNIHEQIPDHTPAIIYSGDKQDDIIKKTFKKAPGMIFEYIMDTDGRSRFSYCNDAIKEVLGLSPQDVDEDAEPTFKKVHPEDLEGLRNSIQESAKTLNDWHHEFRIIVEDNEEKWLLGHSRPEKGEAGSIVWYGFITDITSRIKFAKELEKTSRIYAMTARVNEMVLHANNQDEVFNEACRIVVEEGKLIMAWVGIVDTTTQNIKPVNWCGFEDGYLQNINAISTRNDLPAGHGPSGVAFREGENVVSNDLANDTSFKLWREEALKRGYASSISLPIFIAGKTIGTFNIYSSNKNFFNTTEVESLDKIAHSISYAIDTIENEKRHRQAEILLRKSELNYRTIFNEAPIGIASVNPENGKFISMNSTYLKLLGRTEEELEKMSWTSVTRPDNPSKYLENISKLKDNSISAFKFSARYERPDNTTVWCDISVASVKNDDMISKFVLMVDDNTERKISDEKLKKSEEMFSAITNLSPDLITIVDKNGKIIFNSDASLVLHCYDRDELIGRNIIDLIHPDDREHVMIEFQNLLNHPKILLRAQYRYQHKDGSFIWMEANGINLLDNPQIGGVITISRDIGLRKKMEEDLRSALATRDEFLSIASHELKTPITSLKLQLQILNRHFKSVENVLAEPQKLTKFIISSIKQVDRVTELVENLLDVSRIQVGKLLLNPENINLSEVVNELLNSYRELFTDAKCPLELSIEPNIIGNWDRNRVEQVFVNLFSNAIKYAAGRPIYISLNKINDKAQFKIVDHGPGISPDNLGLIFERFQRATSSRNISGLGIGLYISKYIVGAHQGSILVESKLGVGSTFTVLLPLTTLSK